MNKEIEKLGKAMPFTVPEGFFDEMKHRIELAVDRERSKRKRIQLVKWSLGAAAAIAMVSTAIISLQQPAAAPSLQAPHELLASNDATPAPAETIAATTAGKEIEAGTQAATESPEKYMSDEDLEEWVAIAEADEFLYCEDMIATL